MSDIKIINEISSHHIIVYLCRSLSWWRQLSHAWGNITRAQWGALS